MDRTTESLVIKATEKAARGFTNRYGGDPEERLAEAYYHAGRAIQCYKEDIGTLQGWVARSVWFGLLETERNEANRRRELPRTELDVNRTMTTGWDCWCRKLATELEGDAAVVVLAAMEAPGEVIGLLLGAGWSGPRVQEAVQRVKEAVS